MRKKKLADIQHWILQNEDIRAALITSSLVNPLAPVDEYSDLDIELVFEDVQPYITDSKWIEKFGDPVIFYEEDEACFDGVHAMKMVQYQDGVKVDFKLYAKTNFLTVVNADQLIEDWDIGYAVLADKDNLTRHLSKASYQVSLIQVPSKERFEKVVYDFYWDLTYLPKCLARGDLFYLKYMMECVIRMEYLLPMLEWYIASQSPQALTCNKFGRLFPKYLTHEEWEEIKTSFAGSDIPENWSAILIMEQIFHRISKTVASFYGFDPMENTKAKVRQFLLDEQEKWMKQSSMTT